MSASMSYSSAANLGLLLIRVMVGVVFMFHGSQKLFGMFGGPGIDGFAASLESNLNFPLPVLNAWLAACAEFFGGVSLVLGLATRIAAVPLVITMLVAAFMVHGGAFSLQHNGMEYALTLGVVVAGLALTGPGAYSAARCMPTGLSERIG